MVAVLHSGRVGGGEAGLRHAFRRRSGSFWHAADGRHCLADLGRRGGRTVSQFLSNQHGAFFTDHLKPGNYAVRVSLAGFLAGDGAPRRRVSNLTTLLRVQVEFRVFFAGYPAQANPTRPPNRTTGNGCCVLRRPRGRSCNGDDSGTGSLPMTLGARSAQRAAAARTGPGDQWGFAARIRLESSGRPRDRCFLRPAARQPGAAFARRPDEL